MLAALLSPCAAHCEVDPTAILDPSGITASRLSPDGKHIASVIYSGLNAGVVVTDVDTYESRNLVYGRRVNDGHWIYNKVPKAVTWAGNDLIAVDYGLVAESINLQGKTVAELGAYVIGRAERDRPDSPLLLVCTDRDDGDVALIDARTGKKNKFSLPPGGGKPTRWAFDKHGELRAVTTVNSSFWRDVSTVSNWYKSAREAEWEKLADFAVADDYWMPMFVPDEPHTLVISSRQGRDTYAVFSYDTQTRKIGDMLAGHPTLDILSVGGIDHQSYLGVRTSGMIPQQVWFDAAWDQLQRSVDAALPNRVNMLSGDPAFRVLVLSYSDVDPGTWYLLETAKMALRKIGQYRLAIDPKQMLPMERISYKAGDGLAIPAFLTRPAGISGPAPLVVSIHGGPTVRDGWEWNQEVQVLAGHGYAVFQPQFRGSTGFGRKFEQAGFGQWGLAMQDDITAGVRHLIDTGVADPKRICIYGASYGGYAALWGLVKTPELYRCGVSFAGVSDIEYMFNDSSDRNSSKVVRELMRSRIGDVRQNKEAFDQVSPLKHADLIKAPVLLMHGDEDERVPISHGKKMKKALEQNHKEVEWLVFEEEGHGLRYVRNQALYFETLLAFLDKYIGAPPAPETKTP
jgi:dipeptidyl aminopeptidase/acylaminoacyl peptidase